MKEVKFTDKVTAVLQAAIDAKVSAMNDQFVPSYSLLPGRTYVLLHDMFIVEPRKTVVTGADGVKKDVNFMEMYIADVTDPKNITFHKISCGQIYNQFKIIETQKREFKLMNLRDLAEGDVMTPSLKMLATALCIDDIKLTPDTTTLCEVFGAEAKDITFFKGVFEKNDAVRTAFTKWLAK